MWREVDSRVILPPTSRSVLHGTWGFNFINMPTHSFYRLRSQKCKKTVKSSVDKKVDWLVVLHYFSRFALYAVRSCLMKLTPAGRKNKITRLLGMNVHPSNIGFRKEEKSTFFIPIHIKLQQLAAAPSKAWIFLNTFLPSFLRHKSRAKKELK